jgi:hypothetical protein
MDLLFKTAETFGSALPDDFEVEAVETIQDYFVQLTAVDKGAQSISEEWARLIKKMELDQLYIRGAYIIAATVPTPQTGDIAASGYFVPTNEHRLPAALTAFEDQPDEAEGIVGQSTLQLSLGLGGDFSPSMRLVDIWIDSVTAIANDASISSERIALPADKRLAQQEFAKSLKSLLAMIAQKLRHSKPAGVAITKDGKFSASYEIQICDRFLILPSSSAEFLSLLKEELTSAFKGGAGVRGAWGNIAVNSQNELYFNLVPPQIVTDSEFIPSEEVE